MKYKRTNENTAAEDELFQQIELSLDPRGIHDPLPEETPRMERDLPSARTQEHMRRLAVEGLCDTDPRRCAKTEYVMRLLVNGRAPLEEPPIPVGPQPPPEPARPAAPEPAPEPKRRAAPKPAPGVITLENLTFDDLLAELENL